MSDQELKQGHQQADRTAKEEKKRVQSKETQTADKANAEPTAEVSSQSQIQKLEEEVRDLNDQMLRRAADFDNFRKRMFREKEESIKYANAALLTDLLAIIDDFERAIQSAADSKDFDAFHTGVSMIEKQMVSILERNWGLKRFSADGELFDPEKHEAIAVEETDEHDTEIVLEDYQKGYLLHDRVLRPAKVKVARPVTPDRSGSDDEQKKEK
jgi:molecular chaperone GrpE